MAVTVTYDGQSPWGAYPPFVSVDKEAIMVGDKWGQVANIQLNGELSFDLHGDISLNAGIPLQITNLFLNNLKTLVVGDAVGEANLFIIVSLIK